MKRVEYWNSLPIIDDDTPTDFLFPAEFGRGHDPSQYVPEMHAAPSEMELISESEYDARIEEQEREQSSLEHVYLRAGWENLDQMVDGYCWGYSTTHAMMLVRSRNNQPHVRLNPHSMCSIIKGGKNEGGWCGLSAKFLSDTGVCSEAFWKPGSRDLSQDTAAMRANMALHKVTENWYDLARNVWDQQLTQRQVDTCVLSNNPCAIDLMWWSHSVCYLRKVKVEDGSYGRLILNSWKGWGRQGLAILRGSKAIPDGAISLRAVTAATV